MKLYCRNSLVVMFVLVCLFSVEANAQENRWKKGIVKEQFIYEEDVYPSCHAGTLAETPDGIVAAWFGGTRERNPDVTIRFSRLVDGEWTKSVEVANGVQNDTLRYPSWNPVLYQIPDGDLLLFYKVGPSPSGWWGMLKRSSDNGLTWSEAEKLPDGFIGPVKNKPLLLDNGDLICGSSTEGGQGWQVHFELTPDFGKTWRKVGPINSPSTYQIIQPSVLKHQDGRLSILCRSKNSVLVDSYSSDNGETWSLPQASGLPNNNSGTDAVSLQDGRQLAVYNHVKTPIGAKKGYRTPLNVAVSDDGKHWSAALVLEDSEISQYSYPAVIQSADGMVHFIYTWRRERMKYVKVDPAKLELTEIIDEKWPEK
jgi:alpha-L-rhamnosidase